ncbi:MAG: magnesium/cobalt transporter CorA [Candidatus Nanoarchaeia archaeon]|nr:magnesium/cobalt transporter CorA [Candidatus Nanoarchaeia archaeon]
MAKNKRNPKKGPESQQILNSMLNEKDGLFKIEILDYDENNVHEKKAENMEECLSLKDKPSVTWFNITGTKHPGILDKIGTAFNIHPLILEDITSTNQRPKVEDFDSYLFLILKMLYYDEKKREIIIEQVSLIVGPNYVISFQETPGDVFDGVRSRIRGGKGKIRKMGSDYLAYALMDAIVDNYFIILEKIGEDIEELEEELIKNPNTETFSKIHYLKGELIYLRKSVWPLREVISNMQKSESEIIKKPTTIYLKDVYDHTIQVVDSVETFRDVISGMIDVYLSSLSYKMNEVMKVLTMFASIFIPLTFIVGLYGMNFKYFPEINWRYGYAFVWAIMISVVVGMFIYFKRKKWI